MQESATSEQVQQGRGLHSSPIDVGSIQHEEFVLKAMGHFWLCWRIASLAEMFPNMFKSSDK